MPGFVVNGNQYTSGRNVIMGKETLTLEDAKQQIKALVEENDNFLFKNAELREKIEAWRKRSREDRSDYFSTIVELRQEWAYVIDKLNKKIYELNDQIDELNDKLEKLWYPERKTDWTIDEVVDEFDKWEKELAKVRGKIINNRRSTDHSIDAKSTG
jgi:chromosome segregation ATPase